MEHRLELECTRCSYIWPLDNYYKRHEKPRQPCKDCSRKTGREYLENHRKERKIYKLSYDMRTKYGLTIEETDNLFQKFHNRCAICNRHQSEFARKLHIDHNHTTGKVRGILCYTCNSRIVRTIEHYKSFVPKVLKYLEEEYV